MDLWLVAAATGAGYLAKYWQQLTSTERDDSFGNSVHRQPVSFITGQQLRDETNSLRRISHKDIGRDFPLGREDILSETGMASTSGVSNEKHEYDNVLSLTSLLPELHGKESLQADNNSGNVQMYTKSRKLEYRSQGYFVRPVNSLESCLLAQLYKEHAKMEDYVYRSFQSPSTAAVRPLFVTDGSRIISRASRDFRGEMQLDEDEMLVGASRGLSNIGSSELLRKQRSSVQRVRPRRTSSYTSRLSVQSQGSNNGMHLLFLGITIGITSTITKNNGEMRELKERLKQSQSLAKDLHEELEMKDSMTVTDLTYGEFESTGRSTFAILNREPISYFDDLNSEEELYDKKVKKYDSTSMIEAELEAELERLELSMKDCSLEKIVEIDPDSVLGNVDVEKKSRNGISESDMEKGISGNRTHDPNYVVSPWELSLRLHEVIQSRLEARIEDLERALESSQRRVHLLESERMIYLKNEYNETESSTQESLSLTEEDEHNVDQPLLLNLSGEALAAYNEAYEEIQNMAVIDKESSPLSLYNDDRFSRVVQECDRIIFQGQRSKQDDSLEENFLTNSLPGRNKTSQGWTLSSSGPNDMDENEYEENSDDDNDEIGQLLIKQIVEKARQGSSAVLNAQRILDSRENQ